MHNAVKCLYSFTHGDFCMHRRYKRLIICNFDRNEEHSNKIPKFYVWIFSRTTYPLAKSGTEAACAFGYVFLDNEFVQKWFEKADGFMKWPVHCRSCILKDTIYIFIYFSKERKRILIPVLHISPNRKKPKKLKGKASK